MEAPPTNPDQIAFDREQAFLLYAAFCGDIEKTAHALGITPISLLRVVDDENWTSKLAPIIELRKSGRPGDLERAMNRAVNFVQAHRLRLFLERTMRVMLGWTEDELQAGIVAIKTGKDLSVDAKLSTRAFADFASALEKAHALTYMALGDTGQDRAKRKESADNGEGIGDMHVRMAEAMKSIGKSVSPRAALLDSQLEVVQTSRMQAAKPEPAVHPNNDDTH